MTLKYLVPEGTVVGRRVGEHVSGVPFNELVVLGGAPRAVKLGSWQWDDELIELVAGSDGVATVQAADGDGVPTAPTEGVGNVNFQVGPFTIGGQVFPFDIDAITMQEALAAQLVDVGLPDVAITVEGSWLTAPFLFTVTVTNYAINNAYDGGGDFFILAAVDAPGHAPIQGKNFGTPLVAGQIILSVMYVTTDDWTHSGPEHTVIRSLATQVLQPQLIDSVGAISALLESEGDGLDGQANVVVLSDPYSLFPGVSLGSDWYFIPKPEQLTGLTGGKLDVVVLILNPPIGTVPSETVTDWRTYND